MIPVGWQTLGEDGEDKIHLQSARRLEYLEVSFACPWWKESECEGS